MRHFLEARNLALAFFVLCTYSLFNPFPILAYNLSELEWVKHEGSVFETPQSGTWENGILEYPVVITSDGIYEMWYSGSYHIGYANSTDGIHWLRPLVDPVLRASGGWESHGAYAAAVVKDISGYEMWYSGYDGTIVTSIGYANSSDGISWKKYGQNPVLERGSEGVWDDRFIDNAMVIKENSGYQMWYRGISPLGASSPQNGAEGYAISINGIYWTKKSQAVFNYSDWKYHPTIVKGENYLMFYQCNITTDRAYGKSICYSTSPDGINWTTPVNNTLISVGPAGSWDSEGLDYPTVVLDGDTFKMWYVGYDASGRERIGYAYTRLKTPACPNEPEQKLLESLNNYPYDFYNEYYNYDDNAISPDSIKLCYAEVDENDTWMVRAINGSYATYPMKASFIGPNLGIDFNTWYNWSTTVKTPIPGENKNLELNYPEFEFRVLNKIKSAPSLKKDAQKSGIVESIINSTEFSLNLGGLYNKGPIERVNTTRAQVSNDFAGQLVTPGKINALDCNGDFKSYYDSDTDNFSSDWVGQIGCSGSTYLKYYNLSYDKNLDIDLGLVNYSGLVKIGLNFTPQLDAGVNLRLLPPNAYVVGGKTNIAFRADAMAIGTACRGDVCTEVNRTIDLPEVSEFKALSEMVGPLDDFEGLENVDSIMPRLSDGKTVTYRNLRSYSPVFRVEGSQIKVKANLCINISDFNMPCQNLNCVKCLYKGEILKINPWEIYAGETKIIVHSPVQIHVYDEFGNHAGINSSGGYDYGIEGSTYAELSGESDEKVLSFTTNTDKFFVLLNGTGDGSYRMAVQRPIMIEASDGIVFREVVYEIGPIDTHSSKRDYFGFDFEEIERLVNKKVHDGMAIDTAINEALAETVTYEEDMDPDFKPTIISIWPQEALNGQEITLTSGLLSIKEPLEGEILEFYVDGSLVGLNITDGFGMAQLTYAAPEGLDLGKHELNAFFRGTDNYASSISASTLEILNRPPKVSLEAPSYAKGTVEIRGTIEDLNTKSSKLLIDDAIVSSGTAYLWDTSGQDGTHVIELAAEGWDGESVSDIKLVVVDNTEPKIQISGVESGKFYNTSVAPIISISDLWLKNSSITLDGSPYENGSEISAEGKHMLEINATDYLENSARETVEFYIDKTPPTITLSGITDGATYHDKVVFSYSLFDNLDRTPYGSSNYPNGTIFSNNGSYAVWVSAVDAAGNSNRKEASFSIISDCLKNRDCTKAYFCNKSSQCQKGFSVVMDSHAPYIYREGSAAILIITIKPLSNLPVTSKTIAAYNGQKLVGEFKPQFCVPSISVKNGFTCLYTFKVNEKGTYSIDAKVNGDVIGNGVEKFTVLPCRKCWMGCC